MSDDGLTEARARVREAFGAFGGTPSDDLVEAVALAAREDVADRIQQSRADALEDFAHNHVRNQTPGRMAEDLLERAATIREGIAPIYQSWCDDCEQDIETQDEAAVGAFNRKHEQGEDGCRNYTAIRDGEAR